MTVKVLNGHTVNLPRRMAGTNQPNILIENATDSSVDVETEENLDGVRPQILIKIKKPQQQSEEPTTDPLQFYRALYV